RHLHSFLFPCTTLFRSLSIDLSKQITNPFADIGGTITMVGQPTVSGPIEVTTQGLMLEVKVNSVDASGAALAQVRYTVADHTNEDRKSTRLNSSHVSIS